MKIVIDDLERSPEECKKLRRLLLKDKFIRGLLVLDAVLCVAGIIAYVLFRGSEYSWWASPLSCVASVVMLVAFVPLLCWWFESDRQVQVAKGNETAGTEYDE